ncbi:hypothetical protein ACS4RR_015185 [Rhizobium sp. Z1P35]
MDYDTRFAKRVFPASAKTIDSLAARDDNFRELCADNSPRVSLCFFQALVELADAELPS